MCSRMTKKNVDQTSLSVPGAELSRKSSCITALMISTPFVLDAGVLQIVWWVCWWIGVWPAAQLVVTAFWPDGHTARRSFAFSIFSKDKDWFTSSTRACLKSKDSCISCTESSAWARCAFKVASLLLASLRVSVLIRCWSTRVASSLSISACCFLTRGRQAFSSFSYVQN